MSYHRLSSALLQSLLWIVLAVVGLSAHAHTFTVTNLNDSGPGSLRQAVLDANAAAGADTIVFLTGLNGTIRLLSGRIAITDSLTINGPGADILAISGNNALQIFYINGSGKTFSIDGLTLKEGGNTNYGGAIQVNYGTLTLSNSTLSRNSARYGGGIYNGGTLIIRNSLLTGNTMTGPYSYGGGGIFNYQGTLTVIDSTLSGNTATEGGGIFNFRGTLTVIDSTLSGNVASTHGGGIGNDGGRLMVINSTLSGNVASSKGGGLHNSGGQQKTVTNSTLSGNTATSGGGIYNYRTPLTVINSTLSGNTAQQNGGGIYGDGGTTTAINSTVSGNSAEIYGGGGFFTGTLRVGNSIVAGNVTLAPGSDVFMSGDSTTFDSQGHNLFSVNGLVGAAPVANDLILTGAIDTAIGPLADNGGPTTTHLPVPGSPVIDAGDNALIPADITTDQRGYGPRILGNAVDIGAVETGATTDPATTLITHYYVSILGREPESEGLAFWKGLIAERQSQGLDAKPVFRDMAYFFFNSPEYLGNNTSNTEFTYNLYRTFFQRDPESNGLEFWLNQLALGVSRNQVMSGFLYSPEFTAFMRALGF